MRYLLLLVFVLMSTLAEDMLKDFSKENMKFSADVYKHLSIKPYGDFVASPLSLEIALALIDTGAKGKTAQQLSSGLHLSGNLERTALTFMQLTSALKGNDEYNLSSANQIYITDSVKIRDSFKKIAVTAFDTRIETIDFTQNTEAAYKMNKWVENKTNGIIKNLIKVYDLNEATFAVLINAMHFQGLWANGFPPSATKERPFRVTSEHSLEIDMMELTGNFNYYQCSILKAKFLELPYLGKDVTMTIVLPNKVEGLRAIEGRIEDALAAPQYKKWRVKVVLPKFTVGTITEFKPVLQALGIRDAFEDRADFSGITKVPLKISKVPQKAFINVDERGTTAAAGTAVQIVWTMQQRPPRPKKFTADHPFIFYLKYKSTIMFVGRYVSGD